MHTGRVQNKAWCYGYASVHQQFRYYYRTVVRLPLDTYCTLHNSNSNSILVDGHSLNINVINSNSILVESERHHTPSHQPPLSSSQASVLSVSVISHQWVPSPLQPAARQRASPPGATGAQTRNKCQNRPSAKILILKNRENGERVHFWAPNGNSFSGRDAFFCYNLQLGLN